MKDYSLTEEEKQFFIKNFEIEKTILGNDDLVLHMANGDEVRTEYTRENKRKFLYMMRDQVMNAGSYLKHIRRVKDDSVVLSFVDLGIAGIVVLFGGLPLLIIPGAFLLKNFGVSVYAKSKVLDIYKNRLFIENQLLFNKYDMTEDVLKGISKKARKVIASKEDIDLNDMDSFTFYDVYTIIERVKRNRKMNSVNPFTRVRG